MSRQSVLFTVLCSVLFVETADVQKKAVIKKLANCKGHDDLALTWNNGVVTYNEKKELTIGIRVVVSEVIDNLAILTNLQKCDSSGNANSCEVVVKDYNASNICELIEQRGELWSDFIDKFDKRPSCPIQPGVYSMEKCVIDTNVLNYLPLTDAVWKLQLTGYVGSKLVSCVELEEQLLTTHKKRGRKQH